jgi:hypothetical protein
MLIHELRVSVTPQQDAEIVKPCDNPLQFYSVHEENRERCFVFSDVIEKGILKALNSLCSHVKSVVVVAALLAVLAHYNRLSRQKPKNVCFSSWLWQRPPRRRESLPSSTSYANRHFVQVNSVNADMISAALKTSLLRSRFASGGAAANGPAFCCARLGRSDKKFAHIDQF